MKKHLIFFGLFGMSSAQTDCHDVYDYCPGMAKFCGKPEFSGVDTYCPKTCGNCIAVAEGTKIQPVGTVSSITVKQMECYDKSWCNGLICRNVKYATACPIVCGHPSCQNDKEHTTTVKAKLEENLETCQDNPDAKCELAKQFCSHDTYGQQMRQLCPETCGVCSPAESFSACEDKSDTCESVKSFCNQKTTHSMMRVQCPETCGFCFGGKLLPTTPMSTTTTTTKAISPRPTIPACKDRHEKCGKLKIYCTHKINGPKVRGICPKTCDVCESSLTSKATPPSPTPVAVTCKDRTPKWCQTKKNLCKNKQVLKTMKFKCEQTCGFCSSGVPTLSTKAPTSAAATAKFGAWSQWSRCARGKTYQKRKCLVDPCNKRQLYNIKKC